MKLQRINDCRFSVRFCAVMKHYGIYGAYTPEVYRLILKLGNDYALLRSPDTKAQVEQ